MNKRLGVFATVGLLALLGACQVQWISLYDEQTDRNVTAYQKNMNSHFERLKDLDWPECSYDANKDFYADALGDATVILTRAESLQKNSQTIQQTTALKDNLVEVRDTHKDSDTPDPTTGAGECLSDDYIRKSQDFTNQIIRATLWLEQGKKRQFGKVSKEENPPAKTLPSSLEPRSQ
jgi:hypothetical protein